MEKFEQTFKLQMIALLIVVLVGAGAYAAGYARGHSQTGAASGKTANAKSTGSPETLAPTLGSKTATLTVKEYADYQCPYCSVFNKQMLPQLKQDFIDTGKIRFEFINAPLLGDESVYSAAAAYCANDQNMYWKYHDELYQITSLKNNDESHPVLNKGIFSASNLKQYAGALGLDQAKFNQCLDSNKYVSTIVNETMAVKKLGINGTPYFVIGNQSFDGLQPYSIIKSLIEAQL